MSNKSILLNLGCGTKTPVGWVNIDSSWNAWFHKFPILLNVVKIFLPFDKKIIDTKWSKQVVIHNISKKLPFNNNSVDGIYLSHVLEHLDRSVCENVLVECYRVLKKGKYIRVIVPDIFKLTKNYQNDFKSHKKNAADVYLDNLHIFLSEEMSWLGKLYFFLNNTDTHKWMYDERSMTSRLKTAGFVNIKKCKFNESNIPTIEMVDQRERFIDAICLEGLKSK